MQFPPNSIPNRLRSWEKNRNSAFCKLKANSWPLCFLSVSLFAFRSSSFRTRRFFSTSYNFRNSCSDWRIFCPGEVWMVEPGLRASNRTLLLRNMFWDPAAGLENNGAGLEQMIAGKLFVLRARVLAMHSFAYVADFVLLRDVCIRTQRAAVASMGALPTYPPISLFSHPSPYNATHLPLPVNFYNRTKLLPT
jgi:hypothetical protein